VGIALGYLLAHRLKRWLFAVEAAIGLYSISAVALIMTTGSYASEKFLGVFPVLPQLCVLYSVAFLLPPAVLIGVSIPVLSRYMEAGDSARPFDRAYLFYNFGAAATILIVEFSVLPHARMSRAVLLVAAINLLIALLLFLMRRAWQGEDAHPLSLRVTDARKTIALVLLSMASAGYQLLLLKMGTFVFGPFRENFSLTVFTAIVYISAGTFIQSRKKLSFAWLLQAGACSILAEAALFKTSAFFLSYALARYGHIMAAAFLLKMTWIAFWGLPLLVFGMSVPVLLSESAYRHVENASGALLFYSSAGNALGFAAMFFIIHPLLPYGAMMATLALLLVAASIIH
jgi:hypothetical protein